MTNEKIFELMDEYFHLGCIHDSSYIEYVGQEKDFVKFARKIYEEGYEQHRKAFFEEICSGWREMYLGSYDRP